MRVTPVEQLDFETGEVLNLFPSVKEAEIETGNSQPNIHSVLRGRSKSAGGFFWRRAGDDALPPPTSFSPVEQLDFETGEVINSFPSAKQAASELGISQANISMF